MFFFCLEIAIGSRVKKEKVDFVFEKPRCFNEYGIMSGRKWCHFTGETYCCSLKRAKHASSIMKGES